MGKQIDEKIAASWVLTRDLTNRFLGDPSDDNKARLDDACKAHQELMTKVTAILG